MNVKRILLVVCLFLFGLIAPATASTASIWPGTVVPGLVDGGPDSSVELGVVFQSDIAGTVSGIRFYKSASNTGTHVGNLWSNSGALLGTGTFSGESASGWQQLNFAKPVAIVANTQYVASYHAGAGHYSADLKYFASNGVDNPPLHALSSQSSGGNGVYTYGSASQFPRSTWNDSNYWVDVVFQSGSTALAIATTSLPGGIVNGNYSATVTANGGTTPYTWTLSAGALPPGLTLNPASGVIGGTATVTGTFSFTVAVADASSPVQTASAPLSIPIAAVLATTGLWPATAVPVKADGGADSPVELGVRFHSDVAGNIAGIRFYKASANTGTHVGNLWSASGSLLATAAFAGESASGWQQILFATPVAIAANTDYVASYHAGNGHYSADLNYFASGVDNPPLHASANGVGGGNGLYAYGTASLFPNQTWNATNYWVDLVFQSGSQGSPTPPIVNAVSPGAGASGVGVGSTLMATFNEAMSPGSISTSTILLSDSTGAKVAGAVLYDPATFTASLSPSKSLTPGATYTAAVKGGSGGVTDAAGDTMGADYTWGFTTTAGYGAKGGGPGGPILIISDTSNYFSEYYAEILLAEGLNEFDLKGLSSVTSTTLAGYDVVLLGQIALTGSQVSMLTDWVNAGGRLIAMRPDKQLAGLLGLNYTNSTLSEGYLLVNTGSGPGAGIVNQTIQYHGTADRYTSAGASSLANLYSNSTTAANNPAVTLRNVGANGGQAAAFSYDLARSIVYTRQGNPAWEGQDRDGLPPIRSDDLFYGAASFDPQPDWVDLTKVSIPQADEQQRFLANLITLMESGRRLLPRFWYFPHGNRAVVVMTGDDHANGGTAGRFENYLALSASNSSVADWTAIRGTSYIYVNSQMTDAMAASYAALGFEIALHLNTGCSDYTRSSLETMFTQQLSQFTSTYPSLPPMTTHRVHCIAWSDYTSMPEVELEHGIRLDTSYYYWPPSWVSDNPGLFTGSAMPMRFVKTDGNTIDVYQAVTQMTDESGQTYPKTIDALLDAALGPNGYYGAFVANMHTDFANSAGSDWILASALSRGVPIISARQLLTWCDARSNSAFQAVSWANNTLSFAIRADSNGKGLEAMAPIPAGYKVAAVAFNGSSIPFTLRGVKGVQYAVFPALSGNYQVNYVSDSVPPAITSVTPASGASGVFPGAVSSVSFSEALNPSTVNATTMAIYNSANAAVPATVSYNGATFSVSITPASLLGVSTTYTLRIKGGAGGVSDAAGNYLSGDYTSSFTTGASQSLAYSIWNNSTTPAVASVSDSSPVEVGAKFTTAVAGFITALRFFKGAANTGVHIGDLWTSTGTLLASVQFAGETASGWQTQALTSPVAIAANTTYVVSYHTAVGRYATNAGYFAISGAANYPLRALGDGETGGNGVYIYKTNSAFPTATSGATNYWVDVVFTPGS